MIRVIDYPKVTDGRTYTHDDISVYASSRLVATKS